MPEPPRSVLIVATQRMGDVLLATPLIRSLRAAWPAARLHALVFDDTAGVLAANPDLDTVLTVARRPPLRQHLTLFRQLWRRYDLALSTGAGDRPTLYAWAGGRRRIGLALPGASHAWKRKALDAWVAFDDLDTHTIALNLQLADALGIERCYHAALAWSAADEAQVRAALGSNPGPIAVLHLSSKFRYKDWRQDGWIELGRWLSERGMTIVLTGSDEPAERAAIEAVRSRLGAAASTLAPHFSLPQVACLLSRASLAIGPDTVVTHAAAASGVPTVALFGPSNPVKWGPWPRDQNAGLSPYRRRGSQHVGNVFLLQGEGACVPCLQEGCDRHTTSLSACLQQLPARRVIAAVETMLRHPDTRSRPGEAPQPPGSAEPGFHAIGTPAAPRRGD
ncbi:MAG: glycosyltransferase family 9 protein [Burkholderiales bacterium]|nr:glycosyltransferase family 9 protein [Burkholderiales bacterium]